MQFVSFSRAVNDFRQARRRAQLEELLGRLTGTSFELLAYDDVRRQLRARGQIERGLREIPLDAIIGSVGRYADFSRTFLPRIDANEERWAKVKVAQYNHGLPPITVYKIGETYFVQDGHHRVSIARQTGATTIEANVIEVQTAVPLTPDVQPRDLILKAEYADFLAATRLDVYYPDADFEVTSIGQHLRLLEHIEIHHYYMGLDEKRDVPFAEAVRHWYTTVYQPVVQLIREHGVLREFPDRTETDLYLWLAKHRAEVEAELGWTVTPAAAVSDLVDQFGSYRPATTLSRVLNAVGASNRPATSRSWWRERAGGIREENLFANILLPLSDKQPDWGPLDAAIFWAHQESSQIIGLYAADDEAARAGITAQAVRAEFQRRLTDARVPAYFKLETGSLARLLAEHTRWADLVVMPMAPEPAADLNVARLITQLGGLSLLVPAELKEINRIALLYDGEPHTDELLYLAAYLGQSWHKPLTILMAAGADEMKARNYLQSQLVPAEFVPLANLDADTVLQTVIDCEADGILLSGFEEPDSGRRRPSQLVQGLIKLAALPLLVYA